MSVQSLEELSLNTLYERLLNLSSLDARNELVNLPTVLLNSLLELSKERYYNNMSIESNKLDILIVIEEFF